jgi:hypothetical protein
VVLYTAEMGAMDMAVGVVMGATAVMGPTARLAPMALLAQMVRQEPVIPGLTLVLMRLPDPAS